MEINQKLITRNLDKKGIFHLKDLVSKVNLNRTESMYIEFKPKFKKKLFKDLLKVSGTITNLSKEIDINFVRLWDQLTRCPFSLSIIKKISNNLIKHGFSNYFLNKLEKKIFYIKSGGSKSEKLFYPKFPINFLIKECMRFISHIYHDGSIGKGNKQPHYRNYSKEECLEFLRDSQKIFGKINRKLIKNKDKTYSIHLPTIIGEIMIAIGYIPGDKTKNNSKTFEFLNNINDEDLISEFLAKAFNDDGHVGKREVSIQQASLIKKGIKKPSNILILDKLFLEKLKIKVHGPNLDNIYKNRYGKCSKYSIHVYSKKNLKVFNRYVKLIDYKRKKLESYLNKNRNPN